MTGRKFGAENRAASTRAAGGLTSPAGRPGASNMKAKPWRDRYHVHPAADLFPMMSDAELAELGKDIKRNGLAAPIVLWTDNREFAANHTAAFGLKDSESTVYLLDGRNRLEAMDRAGIDPSTVRASTMPHRREQSASAMRIRGDGDSWEWVADLPDPVAYVMSANITRRHLTSAQKRALIAKLLTIAPERSDRQVAKDVGADHKTVATVRDEQAASGEIPQSDERLGADGRTTKPNPARKPKPTPAAAAATAPDEPTGWPEYGRRMSNAPEDLFARAVDNLVVKVDILNKIDTSGIIPTSTQRKKLAHILHVLGKVRRTVEQNAIRATFPNEHEDRLHDGLHDDEQDAP